MAYRDPYSEPSSLLGLRLPTSTIRRTHVSLYSHFISFRHPGYPDTKNLLFRLPAHDGWEASEEYDPQWDRDMETWTGGSGIHNSTALSACRIVACNIDGVLSIERLQAESLPIPPVLQPEDDEILSAPEYYFYPVIWFETGDINDLEYAICPSFSDWEFPHDDIPQPWFDIYNPKIGEQMSLPVRGGSNTISMRDRTCRITNFGEATTPVHLVPKSQIDWFNRNEMHKYNTDNTLSYSLITSDNANLVLLRADLQFLMETPLFVFVPKCGKSYVHFLMQSDDYGRLFHNRQTEEMRVAPEFLYARFAWAILQLSRAFSGRVGVKVTVWNEEKGEWEVVRRRCESETVRVGTGEKRRRVLG